MESYLMTFQAARSKLTIQPCEYIEHLNILFITILTGIDFSMLWIDVSCLMKLIYTLIVKIR